MNRDRAVPVRRVLFAALVSVVVFALAGVPQSAAHGADGRGHCRSETSCGHGHGDGQGHGSQSGHDGSRDGHSRHGRDSGQAARKARHDRKAEHRAERHGGDGGGGSGDSDQRVARQPDTQRPTVTQPNPEPAIVHPSKGQHVTAPARHSSSDTESPEPTEPPDTTSASAPSPSPSTARTRPAPPPSDAAVVANPAPTPSAPPSPPLGTAPMSGASLPAVGSHEPPPQTRAPTSSGSPSRPSGTKTSSPAPVAAGFTTPSSKPLLGVSDSLVLASVLAVLGLSIAVMIAGAGRRARRSR